MSAQNPVATYLPLRLASPAGLSIQVNRNGSIKRLDHGDIIINLFLGTEIEGGPANIYLRRRRAAITAITPLLGPRSPATVHIDQAGMTVRGDWQEVRFCVRLVLAQTAPAWFWHVELRNMGPEAQDLDLIYAQDLALAHYGAVRLNEYYVSHYLDHSLLAHPRQGCCLATRQNLSMGGCYPWAVIGSLGHGISYATDALQVHGLASRAGQAPVGVVQGLPGVRQQHEHAMAAIQDAPLRLEPQAAASRGFFGWFAPDHPAATTAADLCFIDQALSLPEARPEPTAASGGNRPAASLFSTAPLLDALELSDAEIAALFGAARRHEERAAGRLLSFFIDASAHVVLKAKELTVLRPHGHILRTGGGLTPDEAGLTSTAWMAGVFHSMLTQGHVSINRFLSSAHSYLGLFRSDGLRIFVELAGLWHLLDVPSAFEVSPEACRWIYRHQGGLLEVRGSALIDRHALTLSARVISGASVRFLVAGHVAIGGDDGSNPVPLRYRQDAEGWFIHTLPDCDLGWRFPDGGFRITPDAGTIIEKLGCDELLFADGASRQQPFLCLLTAPSVAMGLTLTGCLVAALPQPAAGAAAKQFWSDISAQLRIAPPAGSPWSAAAARLGEIMPWFVNNALIHYLAPRGLEQYSGGGWGTRDVSQGPVEMLLALGRPEAVRDILVRVFKQQNTDGDWPQWFMFFDRERSIRPGDSHGDIVFWPVLALAQYLAATGDGGLLDETVPFFHADGDPKAEQASVWQHVERALDVMRKRVIPGTHLAAYGNGDWNDSLQPVQPEMRQRLCSSWTVTLHCQTLSALAGALQRLGKSDRAEGLQAWAEMVRADFQRLLIVDEVIAGFGYFHADGRADYLLHPRDQATGLSYSLLPMMHAVINDLVTPEQARRQLALIKKYLLGPDGARLFDRPLAYHGGLQTYFQRAESTSFFGRENGLMYTHAHLRYAEALAHVGDAENFFLALCRACPISLRELVPSAAPRQANCYYSSSDPAFRDRYQAAAEYDRVQQGAVDFEGGWRVYSSGAGICVRLILQNLLGLRWETGRLVVDPVIPQALDGLQARLRLAGRLLEVTYAVRAAGCGPRQITLNGAELAFTRVANPYRPGAAEVSMADLLPQLTDGANRMTVRLG